MSSKELAIGQNHFNSPETGEFYLSYSVHAGYLPHRMMVQPCEPGRVRPKTSYGKTFDTVLDGLGPRIRLLVQMRIEAEQARRRMAKTGEVPVELRVFKSDAL